MKQRATVWAYICFLALFVILLLLVTKIYLLPAAADVKGANEAGRKLLGAHALLLMSLVLTILGLALILIFRIGRYFMPRARSKEPKTEYTDAWAESAKRMKTPEDE
jgi:hypothetical protein